MPAALTTAERIARSRAYLAEARRIAIPPPGSGHARSSAIQRKRSKLLHAYRALGRLLALRPPSSYSAAEINQARRLAAEIESEPDNR